MGMNRPASHFPRLILHPSMLRREQCAFGSQGLIIVMGSLRLRLPPYVASQDVSPAAFSRPALLTLSFLYRLPGYVVLSSPDVVVILPYPLLPCSHSLRPPGSLGICPISIPINTSHHFELRVLVYNRLYCECHLNGISLNERTNE